jgi:hypothetical protein
MTDKHLYIEQRPEGNYAVRKPNSERASVVCPTQGKAIQWAKDAHPEAAIHVERIRHTKNGDPDKWRKV